MSGLSSRIKAFTQLGLFLRKLIDNQMKRLHLSQLEHFHSNIEQVDLIQNKIIDYINYATHYNPWFTKDFLMIALEGWSQLLYEQKIYKWLDSYNFKSQMKVKRVGVVMAGNIPMVGFHDYLSVILSGHQLVAKLSSDDQHLIPLFHDFISLVEPSLKNSAEFTTDQLIKPEAIIATGSTNTSRYFEYYFGKYPNIIRKNRNGLAVLDGQETEEELQGLCKDIMTYFGLGCRNVSKIYVPDGYIFKPLYHQIESFSNLQNHHKYYNNYEYNKANFLVNKISHFDNGFLMFKEDTSYSAPIAVVYYETYDNLEELKRKLTIDQQSIQCVIGHQFIEFGMAQKPDLHDYADGVDTMQFLMNIGEY